MRRDTGRRWRPGEDLTAASRFALADRSEELPRRSWPSGAPSGCRDRTIEYEVRRSKRRKKTMQITVGGDGVRVAVPSTASNDGRAGVRSQAGRMDIGAGRRLVGAGRSGPPRRRRDPALPRPRHPPRRGARRRPLLYGCASRRREARGNGSRPPARRRALRASYETPSCPGTAAEPRSSCRRKVDRWLPRAVYYTGRSNHPHEILMGGELLPWAVDEFLPRLGHAAQAAGADGQPEDALG